MTIPPILTPPEEEHFLEEHFDKEALRHDAISKDLKVHPILRLRALHVAKRLREYGHRQREQLKKLSAAIFKK